MFWERFWKTQKYKNVKKHCLNDSGKPQNTKMLFLKIPTGENIDLGFIGFCVFLFRAGNSRFGFGFEILDLDYGYNDHGPHIRAKKWSHAFGHGEGKR